jgi:hypothetical protein
MEKWGSYVAAGDFASAGSLTEGGEPRAREIATKLEAAVGKVQSVMPSSTQKGVQTTQRGGGQAEVRIPAHIVGDRASAEGTMVLKVQGTTFLIDDIDLGSSGDQSSSSGPSDDSHSGSDGGNSH